MRSPSLCLSGILQKGDSDFLDFGSFPMVASVAMGTGVKRTVKCEPDCTGPSPARESELLNVVSMASGPDGSIYVGDFNLVRRILPDGNAKVILAFGPGQTAHNNYDLEVSPADGMLYIAMAEKRQIWRVEDVERPKDVAKNWKVFAGNGQRCVLGDSDACGDGGPATDARLAYPKGLAVAVDNTVYVSDGRNIRVIMPSDGKIETLVGDHLPQSGPPRPLPCGKVFPSQEVSLQWPTKLALNPVDGTLHIADDTVVLRLTSDLRIQVVAGISPLCRSSKEEKAKKQQDLFGPIVDLAFSPRGQLYVAEKRQSAPKRFAIRIVDQNGAFSMFSGFSGEGDDDCVCQTFPNCTCGSSSSAILSTQIHFSSLSALSVSPGGDVHVADNKQLRILSFKKSLPEASASGDVSVTDPSAKELYTFNRYGQHTSTHSLDTGVKLYSFSYSKNTVFGRLTRVTDSLGNKLTLQRDYTNRVQSVENTFGQKHSVRLSRFGDLAAFRSGEKSVVTMSYHANSGLLKSKSLTNGDFTAYDYDPFGRISSVVMPTGERYFVSSRIVGCPEDKKKKEDKKEEDGAKCIKVVADGVRILQNIAVHQSGKVVLRHGECVGKLYQNFPLLFSNLSNSRLLREQNNFFPPEKRNQSIYHSVTFNSARPHLTALTHVCLSSRCPLLCSHLQFCGLIIVVGNDLALVQPAQPEGIQTSLFPGIGPPDGPRGAVPVHGGPDGGHLGLGGEAVLSGMEVRRGDVQSADGE